METDVDEDRLLISLILPPFTTEVPFNSFITVLCTSIYSKSVSYPISAI